MGGRKKGEGGKKKKEDEEKGGVEIKEEKHTHQETRAERSQGNGRKGNIEARKSRQQKDYWLT